MSASVELRNGALPAMGPTFFEHCLESQLPARPSLVLVEFTVNLDHNPAAFERMLRKLLCRGLQSSSCRRTRGGSWT